MKVLIPMHSQVPYPYPPQTPAPAPQTPVLKRQAMLEGPGSDQCIDKTRGCACGTCSACLCIVTRTVCCLCAPVFDTVEWCLTPCVSKKWLSENCFMSCYERTQPPFKSRCSRNLAWLNPENMDRCDAKSYILHDTAPKAGTDLKTRVTVIETTAKN